MNNSAVLVRNGLQLPSMQFQPVFITPQHSLVPLRRFPGWVPPFPGLTTAFGVLAVDASHREISGKWRLLHVTSCVSIFTEHEVFEVHRAVAPRSFLRRSDDPPRGTRHHLSLRHRPCLPGLRCVLLDRRLGLSEPGVSSLLAPGGVVGVSEVTGRPWGRARHRFQAEVSGSR